MFIRSLILAAALLAAGCATGPTAYGPKGGEKLGFESTKIQNDRFRVTYTAQEEDEAIDYALLRAAELTVQNGDDWFDVIKTGGIVRPRGKIGVKPTVGMSPNALLRGRLPRPRLGVNMGDVADAMRGPQAISILEIRTGKGTMPAKPSAYNAQEVIQNIKPAAVK